MQQFELLIKNDKAGLYKKLALFMVILSLAVFGLFVFYSDELLKRLAAIGAIALILGFFIFKRLTTFGKNTKYEFERASFFIIIAALAVMNWWLPAAIFLGLLLLYQISQRQLLVSVSASSVVYPSYPKKEIAWDELNNVVLKDDLLTLDLKNNSIIQQLIKIIKPAVDEHEFNDFCRAQLKSAVAAN